MLTIAPIAFNTPMYRDSLALRAQLLRKPLGMEMRPEDVADDAARLHWGAFEQNRLVGSVSLAVSGDTGRVKQMVVGPEMQKQGVGAQLMQVVEAHALQHGIMKIVLNARETAQAFYARLGYVPVGALFEEVGLPHMKMEKTLA